MFGVLDGKARDAAGAALHQNRLAALQLQCVGHRADRGKAGERQSGGIDVRKPIRLLADQRRLDRELLAIGAFAPGIENAEYGVADFKVVDARAECRDDAGEIPPRDCWKLCRARVGILAGTELPVGGVDGCRMHIDDHLPRRRDGVRQVAVFQHTGVAEFFKESGFHLVSYLWFRVLRIRLAGKANERADGDATRRPPRIIRLAVQKRWDRLPASGHLGTEDVKISGRL